MFVMCEKILFLWRNFSMYIYIIIFNRVGFNVINIILGEILLNIYIIRECLKFVMVLFVCLYFVLNLI